MRPDDERQLSEQEARFQNLALGAAPPPNRTVAGMHRGAQLAACPNHFGSAYSEGSFARARSGDVQMLVTTIGSRCAVSSAWSASERSRCAPPRANP